MLGQNTVVKGEKHPYKKFPNSHHFYMSIQGHTSSRKKSYKKAIKKPLHSNKKPLFPTMNMSFFLCGM